MGSNPLPLSKEEKSMLEQLQQAYYAAFHNVIFVDFVNKAVIRL